MIGSKRKVHVATVAAAASGVAPNQAVQENLSPLDRLAVRITDFVGTMGFFLIIFTWNVIQIALMPLIMVGQNLQGRHSEARAEADYLVNQKAFADTENILGRLEALDKKILDVAGTNQQIPKRLESRTAAEA